MAGTCYTYMLLISDGQPFIRDQPMDVYAAEIQDKTPEDMAAYYKVFIKKWKTLPEYERIAQRVSEGAAKRNKRDTLEYLLGKKINSVQYPMQELELNYPTTKGKVYSEEEDRYLLCRLFHYGMQTEDVYERIKKDITEFPVFRFDWFFKSRTPQELQRRCNTLLTMIEKEAELEAQEEAAKKQPKGKVGLSSSLLGNMLISCRNVALMRWSRVRRRIHRGLRRPPFRRLLQSVQIRKRRHK